MTGEEYGQWRSLALQSSKSTSLVTTITAVLVIGMASAAIADAQTMPMMGGNPAAQPGGGMGGMGGMIGHSHFGIVHVIIGHLRHHMKGHMSHNMGSTIHAPAY